MAQQIRRQVATLERALKALEAIQATLPAPTEEEYAEMLRGERLVPLEAHWIARLQRVLADTEAALEALRAALRRENAAWLRELFRSGRTPDADDFAALASALGFRPSGGRR
jgi:hypothetical protein